MRITKNVTIWKNSIATSVLAPTFVLVMRDLGKSMVTPSTVFAISSQKMEDKVSMEIKSTKIVPNVAYRIIDLMLRKILTLNGQKSWVNV